MHRLHCSLEHVRIEHQTSRKSRILGIGVHQLQLAITAVPEEYQTEVDYYLLRELLLELTFQDQQLNCQHLPMDFGTRYLAETGLGFGGQSAYRIPGWNELEKLGVQSSLRGTSILMVSFDAR